MSAMKLNIQPVKVPECPKHFPGFEHFEAQSIPVMKLQNVIKLLSGFLPQL